MSTTAAICEPQPWPLTNVAWDLVGCTCGPYQSIVPPPPCPHHSTLRAVPYNGLCTCRGPFDPHPFHNLQTFTTTTSGKAYFQTEYLGKHRKPEDAP